MYIYYTSIGRLIALISVSTHTGFIRHALYPVSNINVFLYSKVDKIYSISSALISGCTGSVPETVFGKFGVWFISGGVV